MKKFKKDLKAASKALYNIAQQLEKMHKEIDMQVQSTKKTNAKTTKKKAVKKGPAKKGIVSRSAPPTSVDKVFAIIKRSKKGIDAASLAKKTGYERKSISNAIYKLTRQGKIKTIDKGIYVKT